MLASMEPEGEPPPSLMKQRLVMPGYLVSLRKVKEMDGIRRENGGLKIGGNTTLWDIEHSAEISAAAPLVTAHRTSAGDASGTT